MSDIDEDDLAALCSTFAYTLIVLREIDPRCPACKGRGHVSEDPAPDCPSVAYPVEECGACGGSGGRALLVPYLPADEEHQAAARKLAIERGIPACAAGAEDISTMIAFAKDSLRVVVRPRFQVVDGVSQELYLDAELDAAPEVVTYMDVLPADSPALAAYLAEVST